MIPKNWQWQIPRLDDAPEILRGRRRANTHLDLAVPRVSVFCRDEQWHAEDPWLVASFVFDNRFSSWEPRSTYPTGDGWGLAIGYPTVELVGDRPLAPSSKDDEDDDEDEDFTDRFSPDFRVKFNLSCRIYEHSADKVQRRHRPRLRVGEKARPVLQHRLQAAWDAGMPEIPLGLLMRRTSPPARR